MRACVSLSSCWSGPGARVLVQTRTYRTHYLRPRFRPALSALLRELTYRFLYTSSIGIWLMIRFSLDFVRKVEAARSADDTPVLYRSTAPLSPLNHKLPLRPTPKTHTDARPLHPDSMPYQPPTLQSVCLFV